MLKRIIFTRRIEIILIQAENNHIFINQVIEKKWEESYYFQIHDSLQTDYLIKEIAYNYCIEFWTWTKKDKCSFDALWLTKSMCELW